MSASELAEHLGYWNDPVKLDAYQAALAEVVQPTDEVLDLGTGTGLLGMLAARAGAKIVWSFDGGSILSAARALAAHNGLDDRIRFVQGFTTEVALPEVDVIVCDQIGGLVFDAGVLGFFADARKRALRPGGRMVPASFELFLAPVSAPGPFRQVADWNERDGFDLSPMRSLAENTEQHVAASEVHLVADGRRFAMIESSDDSPIKGRCRWVVTDAGTAHGLAGWFVAQMSPSVTMTNDPVAEGRMQRWVNFYPFDAPIEFAPGDVLEASIDIRPPSHVVTWSWSVNGGETIRSSTFLSSSRFDTRTSGTTKAGPGAGVRHDVLVELAGLIARGATHREVLAAAVAHTAVFATEEAAKSFAEGVWKLIAGR